MAQSPLSPNFISVVVPVYNEQTAVNTFVDTLEPVLSKLSVGYEIVFVNDGSTDQTLECLLALRERNKAIAIVDLSRNFGKEAAVVAGLEAAGGIAAIIMDVDLQDPPEIVSEMVDKWVAGADVVIAIRTDRSSDGFLKRSSAKFFYSLFGYISETALPEGSGDFRLMDRQVVDAFLRLEERARFNKGLFAWLGFRQEFVRHVRPQANRGESRWRPRKLIQYAFDGLFSFSTVPIRVWSLVGGVISALSLAYGLYLMLRTMIFGIDMPGYASLMVAMLFFGGVNLFTFGLLGEYIGRILIESKRRPLYIVRTHLKAAPEQPLSKPVRSKKRLPT